MPTLSAECVPLVRFLRYLPAENRLFSGDLIYPGRSPRHMALSCRRSMARRDSDITTANNDVIMMS